MGAGAGIQKVITEPTAFAAAAEEASKIIESRGGCTYQEVLSLYERQENAIIAVRNHFPLAQDGYAIHTRTEKALAKYGVDPENTLFAQSICPDEINHENGDITNILTKHMGEVFHMGGLAGVPFTGKTGFDAFSGHVPDGGNLFILIGSHIGVSDSLQLGKFSRLGQEGDGAACGASVGGLKFCCEKSNKVPDAQDLGSDPDNYQMQYLISEIDKRKDIINAHKDENARQAELAKQTFDIAREFLDRIVHTEFGVKKTAGRLIILGGVQVNMPRPLPDFFQPLMFEIRKQGEPTIDLMSEAFTGSSSIASKSPRAMHVVASGLPSHGEGKDQEHS